MIFFSIRYVLKHTRRTELKSIISVVLAMILLCTICQLSIMQTTYILLYENTVVTAKIQGGLRLNSVPEILEAGYFEDPYYEVNIAADINNIATTLAITNNISRYLGMDIELVYSDGYNASVFGNFSNVIIVVEDMMDEYGLVLGDTIRLSPVGSLTAISSAAINNYKIKHPLDIKTDEEILSILSDVIMDELDSLSEEFIIAGYIALQDSITNVAAFLPGDRMLYKVAGGTIKLDVSEFVLADNYQNDEARSYGIRAVRLWAVGGDFYMDTSKLESLEKTLWLLKDAYLVAIFAAIIICVFLCCLVVIQSSKEASIMRSLGTTRKIVCSLLLLEQVFLNLVGLIFGALVFLLISNKEVLRIEKQIYSYALIHIGAIMVSSIICSMLVTNKSPLKFLQVKE